MCCFTQTSGFENLKSLTRKIWIAFLPVNSFTEKSLDKKPDALKKKALYHILYIKSNQTDSPNTGTTTYSAQHVLSAEISFTKRILGFPTLWMNMFAQLLMIISFLIKICIKENSKANTS